MCPQALKPAMHADPTGRYTWTSDNTDAQLNALMKRIEARDPHAPEFMEAVSELLYTLKPVFRADPKYLAVMEQIVEPERAVVFRVPWTDDRGVQHINRGFRVQYSSAIGPYKGGLRFHPTVNMSVMKFLAFEQIFKNALTGLPIGAGKGGSDFDPKGRSDGEILRFCQSFMTSLWRHIGADTDVPAGDIGVGGREIGYLFGQYKRLRNQFEGVLTGKSFSWGGSRIRPEATGYGAVYFAQEWAQEHGVEIRGARCVVSGSGNVAQYTVEKLIQLGAVPLTMSDSSGYVYEPEGFTQEKLEKMMYIKNVARGRVADHCKCYPSAKYFANKKPWEVEQYKFAFPSATQNEIDQEQAILLHKAGCKAVIEGANMPTTIEAIAVYKEKGITLCPAKAANAGGVAVSALEMSQNSMRLSWTREEVDAKLKDIMKNIYRACTTAAQKYGMPGDLQAGANIAGFLKVADAVIDQGCV